MNEKTWIWKASAAALAMGLGLWLVAPNFVEDAKAWLPKTAVNLGLDLQGGTQLVLGIDLNRAVISEMDNYVRDIRTVAEKDGVSTTDIASDPNKAELSIEVPDAESGKKVETLVADKFQALEMRDSESSSNHLVFGLSQQALTDYEQQVVKQALETLRNRLDQFGVAEPSIQAQGKDRVVVQLPGLDDPERAKAILGKTAQLEFKIVDDESMTPEELNQLVEEAKIALGGNADIYAINAHIRPKLPSGTEVRIKEEGDETVGQKREIPVLLSASQRLSGNLLEDARVAQDENGWPEVSMRFNQAGAEILDELSGKNIQKRLAIVLDDKIYSDPVLQSRIPDGNARITLNSLKGRSQVLQEARDLSLVLRTGALPAPVEILESRTVGPSLGRDSIESGLKAMLVGLLLVMAFIALYYRLAGILADFALIVNLVFIVALLGLLHATLTLPGIAGMLISMAMAIDANVLVYERIREELRTGKSIASAVEQGYERAHVTILDANLTTMIAGLILWEFGTGPIKGFAITLILGLAANYVTAIWFTRIAFDWWLRKFQPKELSI